MCSARSGLLCLHSRKLQEFLVALDALGQKFPVPKQDIGGHRRRHILRLLPAGDMDDLQGNMMRLGRLHHSRHPVVGEGTLIRVIEHEAALLHNGLFGAVLEFRRLCTGDKRQIQQFDPACRGIRRCEALVRQILRVGEKLTLPSLGGQGAQTLSPLRLGIPDALRQ